MLVARTCGRRVSRLRKARLEVKIGALTFANHESFDSVTMTSAPSPGARASAGSTASKQISGATRSDDRRAARRPVARPGAAGPSAEPRQPAPETWRLEHGGHALGQGKSAPFDSRERPPRRPLRQEQGGIELGGLVASYAPKIIGTLTRSRSRRSPVERRSGLALRPAERRRIHGFRPHQHATSPGASAGPDSSTCVSRCGAPLRSARSARPGDRTGRCRPARGRRDRRLRRGGDEGARAPGTVGCEDHHQRHAARERRQHASPACRTETFVHRHEHERESRHARDVGALPPPRGPDERVPERVAEELRC